MKSTTPTGSSRAAKTTMDDDLDTNCGAASHGADHPKGAEVFFLGYGAICTYQYGTLRQLNSVCTFSGTYFQPCTERKLKNLSAEDIRRIIDFEYCTLSRYRNRLPKVFFKSIEYACILSKAARELLKNGIRKKRPILILTGWALMPLVPIGRIYFQKVYVWKFGIAEELLLQKKVTSRYYYHLVKTVEKLFFPLADGFLVQSPGMAAYAIEQARKKRPAFIAPCVAAHSLFRFDPVWRRRQRKEMGLDDRFVVVSLGSFNPWQNADDVMNVFRAISFSKPNAILLLITGDGERYRSYLRKHGIENYRTLQVSHKEVPKLLWASDLGLLMRIEHRVIEVAAPIKYAEYLAAGLPVILTRNIGVYSEYTVRYKLGKTVDPARRNIDEQIASLLDVLPATDRERRRISEFGKENLSDLAVRSTLHRLCSS